MESFLRMSKGMLFHSFAPLAWKFFPPFRFSVIGGAH